MLDSKAKDLCRICARELCGNQRRWIFHPTAKLSLQVLLSHALGRELSRDGRREFVCSKCTFMLDRMYRFDTVIARVEALSIERMQKLLLEKDRLRQCICGLYRKNNTDELDSEMVRSSTEASVVDTLALTDTKYGSMLEENLTYSMYESWADFDSQEHSPDHYRCHTGLDGSSGQRCRKCKGCAALRVADSDYEAVCKVPRKVGRSTSCGPSTRYSASNLESLEETCSVSECQKPDPQSSSVTKLEEENSSLSPATSVESLDTAVDLSQPCYVVHPDLMQGQIKEEDKVTLGIEQNLKTCCENGLELALTLVKSFECHPVRVPRGCRLPVPVKRLQQISQGGTESSFSFQPVNMVTFSIQQKLHLDLADMEAFWMEDYVPCGPLGLQEKLIGEQQAQLVQYENAAGQCVTELQRTQQQVQSLQNKIRESEANCKKLQQRLEERECELLSVREAAQEQQRTIQSLSDSLKTRDNEVADLQQCIKEQKELLISLKQQNQRHELQQRNMSGAVPGQLQAELLQLQVSLFSTQLELQSIQRAQCQAQRREEEAVYAKQRLLADLQSIQHDRQETHKHNQDLQAALQKAHADLEQIEERLNEGVEEKEREMEERERTIRELKTSLEHKENLLHDYTQLLDEQKDSAGNRDILIHKLKLRIRERDRALECGVDERFICMEQKEAEVRKLQLLLREKERDLQKLRCVLSNNEETITSLEVLVRGKALELEQVNDAWRGSQQVQRECENRNNRSLRERDTLISQLQNALHARTKETEELKAALLSKVSLGSGDVVKMLKTQLQLKERLFQELLAEHSHQAQDYSTHIQELLNDIRTREQYIKDSAERTGHVMEEQVARLRELRRQVVSGRGISQNTSELPEDAQCLQEELRLVLSREKEAQRELSVLRCTLARIQEQLNHKASQECLASEEMEQTASSQADTGDSTTDEDLEKDDSSSEIAESTEEDEHCRGTAQALVNTQPVGPTLSQNLPAVEHQGLAEVKLLVEQKLAVERELSELKAQLEKAGFFSICQMRKALFSLRSENEELKISLRAKEDDGLKEGEQEEKWPPGENSVMPTGKRSTGAQHQAYIRPLSSDLESLLSHPTQLDLKKVPEIQKLQEGTKPSNKAVQIQAEPLRHCTQVQTVQQSSKQVQVDLQDLGYETCGRSENEADRDETSSPEFDDLELCTSLSCRDGPAQWWSGLGMMNHTGGDVMLLQQQVEDLQKQLSRSQALVQGLQSRVQDATPVSSPQRLNQPNKDLQELVTRVSSLEDQLRRGKGHAEETKNITSTGSLDTLIQAQARELSHLRQRMREGRSVCHVLTQHLGDTTKAFEELLRANDIDYYMGESFRDQLAQSSSLAQRVAAKISSRDYSEVPDDKTGHELLAIRLSKELQQKDKLIESLRSKLEQQQPRSDTPASSHVLSEASDQSDHTSFVRDEQDYTNEDLDLCSELDTASDFGQEEAADKSNADSYCNQSPKPKQPSSLPSLTSSHSQKSSSSYASMHCTPHRPMDAQPGLSSAQISQTPQWPSKQTTFLPFDPHTQHLRPRYNTAGSFSLAEVHQELQMLQRQLGNTFVGAQVKPLSGFQLTASPQTNFTDLHLLSHQAFQQSSLASLNASPVLKPGTSLLDNSALWSMTHGSRPKREGACGDISSNSSGYQSGARHTGTDLLEEHLNEIRSLHRRLEDSIQTNDCLRRQLEERLGYMTNDGAAPTNIYFQGVDSISHLSNEVRILKEEKNALQIQLQQATRDGMQLRDAVLLERSRLKQAELEAEKWAGQFRQLQTEMREHVQAAVQLKQDKQISQENTNRLQHEVNVLQQQLSESRRLVSRLQCELQTHQRLYDAPKSVNTGSDLQSNMCLLEQQLSERLDHDTSHSTARKRLFHDSSNSPPVRDSEFFSPGITGSFKKDKLHFSVNELTKPDTGSRENEVPDGSFTCKTGDHVVGRWDDFSTLQRQLLEGRVLTYKMEAALQSSMINLHEGCIRNLLISNEALKQILEETSSILKTFWRAALPSSKSTAQQLQKEQTLKQEVVSLKHKHTEQEQTLRDTVETLKDSNRTKDSMEQFIFSQLSQTRDILKKARTNLEKNELRISSLSCSFSPQSPQSFSSTSPWAARGKFTKDLDSSRGQSVMSSPAHGYAKGICGPWAAQPFGPLQMFSGGAASALSTAVPSLC
ncbi:myomegalin isoform X2 [Trichomycterus rosablanca]|uniref:myomegalin isoform X2 n=1 Tax=Trichomycterus rosablanca TaxID=2290929 RepID=UPI002F35D412